MLDGIVLSIDATGGDAGARMVVEGVEYFLKHEGANRKARFLLHGDETELIPLLRKNPRTRERSEIRHTTLRIEGDTKPSAAVRRGKGSAMWNSVASVKAGEARVGVSAGNTGALMAISKLQLRTMQGVQRPAIAAIWPTKQGRSVVLDVGANIEVDATQLTEFAVMGEAYFRALFGKRCPTVGLLNVGTEDLKGNATIKLAHERLRESEMDIDYIGYVEGSDIAKGRADVVVTDGFTGNVALKTAEGTASMIGHFFDDALKGNIWSQFTTALNSYALLGLRKKLDPRRVNGAVMLGLNGIIVKSHGGTDRIGFASALDKALYLAASDFMQQVTKRLDDLHVEDENLGFIA